MVGPFDQHAHSGGGTLLEVEDADFVVGQPDVGDRGIHGREALAQAQVKRVHRTIASGSGGMDAVLGFQRYGCGRARRFCGDLVAHDFEKLQTGVQSLAHQKLKGPLGRFELVTLKLHLLDAVEQLTPGGIVEAILEAMLLELIKDASPPRKIAQKNALAVPDHFRVDVLVSRGVFEHRADVDSALVGEGAIADVGLIAAQRKIGQLGDEAGGRSEIRKALFADGRVAQLQLEVGDDRVRLALPQRSP